jgi:hypothetical protein
MGVINTFRNFYGEYVSYYFLWLVHLIHWIIFPIILGLILYALLLSNYIKKITVYNDNEIRIELKDIILLGFSGLIIIFSDLFQKTWIQKEKMFCYIWGMENVLDNETNNDFKSDQSIDFLFGTKIKVMKKRRFILRNIISYVILGIVIIVYLLKREFGKVLSDEELQRRFGHLHYFKEGRFQPRNPSEYDPKKVTKPDKKCIEIKSFGLKSPQGPKVPFSQIQLNKFSFDLDPDNFAIYWLGHSSTIIEINHNRLIIDPVLDNASPVYFGVQRYTKRRLLGYTCFSFGCKDNTFF